MSRTSMRPGGAHECVPDDEPGDGTDEYRAIFEATGDGVIIADMDGNLVDVNPALCRMHGYSREEMLHLYPTAFIHPAYHDVFAAYMAALKREGAYRTTALDLKKDGTPFPVEVNGTVFTYRGRRHVLGIVRDVSERAQVEERLQEREEQYRSIFEATNDALVITDLEGFCVEANPAACDLYGYTREEMIGTSAAAVTHPDYHDVARTVMETVIAGGTIAVQSINFRKDGAPFFIETRASQFTYRGKPHILAVIHDITERVKARELLEQRVEERTRELEALLDVSRAVTSTLELKPLLDLILEETRRLVDYASASITATEGDEFVVLHRRGPGSSDHVAVERFPLDRGNEVWELCLRGEPVIIDEVRANTEPARAFRTMSGIPLDGPHGYVHAWMAIPLMVKDRTIGILAMAHGQPGYYTEHHATLALGVAQQAAIAIENARLYEQAQELAVLEERQRLSRELHDSVSQALYSIALGAKTARTLAEQGPASLIAPLDFVLTQAERGLAEMRALLFELRPESLESEGLAAALQKQADALTARHQIPVETLLCDEPSTSLPIKEALYRIAQEALHNAVKHARPTAIEVRLECLEDGLVLGVRDDGRGFDASGSFPGHLGLHSMRERAARLGGTLEIVSAPDQGTLLRAYIPS